jgi:diaminopimelate decarboxylase
MSETFQDLSREQLLEVAREFGTPVYVYHAERITRQYQKLTEAFRDCNVRFFFASKALTNVNILKHIRGLGANVDCVSVNEVKLALKAGFRPEQVLFTPNCTDLQEYVEARELGVNINIDSLPMLAAFGDMYGGAYPINIRLNPHIMAGGNLKISTGHVNSKFGISIEQVEEIKSVVRAKGLQVRGIHLHTGSEIKDVEVFLKGLDIMFEMAAHFPDLKVIDLGGGFKVPYRPGDHETDMQALGAGVCEAFKAHEAKTGKAYEVWFEPGKYLVSQSGYFLVKTNVVKRTPAKVFAGVNSGFNHLIRPMFYEAYHHIRNLSNPDGPEQLYTVVGNICETDTFASDRSIAELREGDVLVFQNAGAYGFEMSSRFNSRTRPAEVLVQDGQARLIRRRETFEDLLAGQVI